MASTKASRTCYAVTFRDPKSDGEVTTLKAREVTDSSLGLGFVCVSGFVFDTNTPLVNPAAEALAQRYAHTKRLHLQVYAVLAIEEIGPDHAGLSFDNDRSKLVLLPSGGDGAE